MDVARYLTWSLTRRFPSEFFFLTLPYLNILNPYTIGNQLALVNVFRESLWRPPLDSSFLSYHVISDWVSLNLKVIVGDFPAYYHHSIDFRKRIQINDSMKGFGISRSNLTNKIWLRFVIYPVCAITLEWQLRFK